MSKEKLTAIGDILDNVEEEARNEIEASLKSCMEAIYCDHVEWKEFKVFERSKEAMEVILRRDSLEFLMIIANEAQLAEVNECKICIITTAKTTDVDTTRLNKDTMIAIIRLPKKDMTSWQHV